MSFKPYLSVVLLSFCALIFSACGSSKKVKKHSKYLNQSYIAIKNEIPEAEVTIVNDTIKVLFPNHLLFKINSATINENISPTFERFAKVLNKYHKTKILINGYTDNTGVFEANKELSQKRAENALQKLIDNKVKNTRLFAWGHASNNPIANNNTEEGKKRNRRVEFIVVYDYN